MHQIKHTMKSSIYSFLILLLVLGIKSCGPEQSSQSESAPPVKETKKPDPREFTFQGNNEFILKEHLFFHLREKVVDIDENTFVKHESIEVNGKFFEYSAVIMDKDLMRPYVARHDEGPQIILANYQKWPLDQGGDSIKIAGTIEVIDVADAELEGQPTDIKIQFTAKFRNSYLASSPYSYDGYERMQSSEYVTQGLMVKLDEPRIYGRDNFYLKARIKVLSEDDLANFPDEALPFLRNEIFARHGHVFKTDKMRAYFEKQSWYKRHFYDATMHLNEVERKNALFIKSLES